MFISSVEYPAINSEGETRHIHRLLALTFLPIPEIFEELDVNHIDGVKTNYALDNLEWTTRSGNCLHAYQNGLRDDNVPILVKDLRDDSVVRHYSMRECARFFNVMPEVVFNHLRDYNYGKISWDYYVLIREGQQWPEVDKDLIGAHRNGYPKDVVATNEQMSKIMIFDSISSAAEHFGLKTNTLGMHMRRYGSRPRDGWKFWFMDGDKYINKQGEVFAGFSGT